MKIGNAIDIHKLVANRPLILGGVKIEHHLGLLGHSDADVLTHVICEAIIGALGLGDLGSHFSDKDPKYQNISSLKLLEYTYIMMDDLNYQIGNIDTSIVIEKPLLNKYIPQMKENYSKILKTKNINIKATRGEQLGYIGNEEGALAICNVLLVEK